MVVQWPQKNEQKSAALLTCYFFDVLVAVAVCMVEISSYFFKSQGSGARVIAENGT